MSEEELDRAENQLMLGGQDVPVEITDNHNVHRIVHQEALGLMGNPLVEKHISEHEELLKAGPQEGMKNLMATPMPAPGMATQGMGPGMTPQTPQTPTPGPVSAGGEQPMPEETALQQSLAGMQGGM